MRLLVFSDLHLEHRPDWSMPEVFPAFDVCIAAGDIDHTPAESIRRLASHPGLQRRPTVFVAGNHEFYSGRPLEDLIEEGTEAAAGTNVHFLAPGTVVIDAVRFVGATLWTDYMVMGNRELGMHVAETEMNDHRLITRRAIKPGDNGRYKMRARDLAWHHGHQRAFIAQHLAEPFLGPTVVVSHHAPSRQSIPARFADLALNAAYASSLEDMIEAHQPALWVHGHMHESCDYRIGRTSVRTNPKGYGPGAGLREIENARFDPHLVVELPT